MKITISSLFYLAVHVYCVFGMRLLTFLLYLRLVTCPTRLSVGIMLFIAAFASYLLRVNMSINILGMVEPSNRTNAAKDVRLDFMQPPFFQCASFFFQPTISCVVWTAIWLECKRTEHHFRRLFLGIYANANPRWNSGRLVWWATCDRHLTCAECDRNDLHSVCGEAIVLGCVHFAIQYWAFWSKIDAFGFWIATMNNFESCSFLGRHFSGNSKSHFEMGAAQWEREVCFDSGRRYIGHRCNVASGRLAHGQLWMGVSVLCSGPSYIAVDCALVFHRFQSTSRTSTYF